MINNILKEKKEHRITIMRRRFLCVRTVFLVGLSRGAGQERVAAWGL